jgi:hypothetical protein
MLVRPDSFHASRGEHSGENASPRAHAAGQLSLFHLLHTSHLIFAISNTRVLTSTAAAAPATSDGARRRLLQHRGGGLRGAGGAGFGGSFSSSKAVATDNGGGGGSFSASVGVKGSGEATARGVVGGTKFGVLCTGPSCSKSISGGAAAGGDGGGGGGARAAASDVIGDIAP